MLFSDKYPEANEHEQYEHGNYIWSPKADNCYICGKLTHFIELNAGAHICSEECDDEFYFQMYAQTIGKNINFDF